MFEASQEGAASGDPAIGGGRYDRLLSTLGAKADIPAVGAAIWMERLRANEMSDKLVLAVPSKGRLQENANAFFARAGLP